MSTSATPTGNSPNSTAKPAAAAKHGHEVRDALVTEIALRTGKLSAELLAKGRAVLQEMEKFGISRGLLSVLAERKLLDRQVEKDVVREFQRLAVPCPRCRKALLVEAMSADGNLKCKGCETVHGVQLRIDASGELEAVQSVEELVVLGPAAARRESGDLSKDHSAASGPNSPNSQKSKHRAFQTGASDAHDAPVASLESRAPEKKSHEAKPAERKAHAAPARAPSPRAATEARVVSQKPEPTAAALHAPLNPRTLIKSHEIETVIASGPHGRLYRLKPKGNSRSHWCLKALADSLTLSGETVGAYQDRLQAWNRLPGDGQGQYGIVEQEGGITSVVRPYADGDAAKLQPLSAVNLAELEEPIEWFHAIVDALAAAHEAGVHHGNLKPSNVLLHIEEGRISLLDPGLDALLPQERGLSRWKCLVASPRYHAPEVIDGAPPSRQSDVYALGWVLYVLLTRNAPFLDAQAPDILVRHSDGPVPDLPPEHAAWRPLFSALTAVKPGERPQDAVTVAKLLAEIKSGKAVDFPPVKVRAAASRVEERRKLFSYSKARRFLGVAALVVAAVWLLGCFLATKGTRAAFAERNRDAQLYYEMSADAFRKTQSEAKTSPEKGRELWQGYLAAFPDSPLSGAAKSELTNFPAAIPPRPAR